MPRVVDHVEDVLIPQVPVAIRREIRPDAARRPDVLALDEVTARTRPQIPVEEEPSPLRGIARPRGHDGLCGGGLGAPIVAAGFALQVDVLARAGGLVALLGATGVLAHAIAVHRDVDGGRWTTEAAWHRFTSWSLLGGQTWLALGFGVAAGRVVALGDDPAGWSIGVLVGPLVIGGVVQIVIGAMTHLMPAIGPGDPLRHGAQRRLLGRLATIRLMALNFGATLVTLDLGLPSGTDHAAGSLVQPGIAAAAAGIVLSLALLAMAARPAGGPAPRLNGPFVAAGGRAPSQL